MSPDKTTLDALRIDRSQSTRRRSTIPVILILLLLVGIGGGWLAWINRPQSFQVRTSAARQVSSGSDRTLLNASGYVTARREATVSSKVTGKVVDIHVEEGMKVEADQILARLDASNVEKNLQLAQAQVTSARAALDEIRALMQRAERELRRVTQLTQDQILSVSDLDRAVADAASLSARLARQEADIAVAEREVALWGQQMEDTVIRAPFTGVVTSKNAQPGEMISPVSAGGGFTRTGICTIVDMSSLEIEVDVSESYINRVTDGQPVSATLDSYPDWRIPCRVIAIIPTADRQKATVKVRVGFEELDPRILPQMSVKVAFQSDAATTPQISGVLVPESALRQDDGRDIVWVVQNDRLERRAVTPGSRIGEDVTLAAGVRAGERIVVSGPDNLADGAKATEIKP